MKNVTATSARSGLFSLIKDSVRTHQPYKITSRAGAVVMMAQDDFEGLIETLELLSTPGLLKKVRKAEKEISQGKVYSMKEVFGQ